MRYHALLILTGIALLCLFGPPIFSGIAIILMSLFDVAAELAAPLAIIATIGVIVYALAGKSQ